MDLGERKKRILSAIVEEYILTGEPVGSKALAKMTGLGLSSATLRNEMSDLVEMGLLEQPHTSAGRIPSQTGYRLYVDRLMTRISLRDEEKDLIDQMLQIREGDLESTLEKAGNALAEITGCASVSVAPQDHTVRLRRLEAVPINRRSMLIVLLTTSGVIKSRICRLNEDVSEEMAALFARLCNEKISNCEIGEISPELINGVSAELYEYTFAFAPAIEAIYEEVKELSGSEIFVGGETNLLNHPDFDSGYIMGLLRLLKDPKELFRIVDGAPGGVKVKIGTENGLCQMQDSSVVTASYDFLGKTAGAIGIIGPKRMDYARMVSRLEYFSSVLSRLINSVYGED